MSANCDVIIIILIYDQFGAIRKPDSGHPLCKTFSIKVTFYFTKTESKLKNL